MMEGILLYIVKSSVYLASFYLMYSLLLRRDTIHRRNRAFILLSLAFSLVLPLISFETSREIDLQVFGRKLSEILITGNSGTEKYVDNAQEVSPIIIMFIVYVLGASLFFTKLIFNISGLLLMIRKHRKTSTRIVRFNGNLDTSGFSALGYIFINHNLSEEETDEIIRHEANHINHLHYIDILFIEILKFLQWFNPFIFLFDNELRAVHEYEADEECLKAGISVTNYQKLLLSQIFRTGSYNMTNSFSNPSLVRKRMIMMTKKRSPTSANYKIITVLPFLVAIFMTLSSYTTNTYKQEESTSTSKAKANEDFPSPPPPPPLPEFSTSNGDTTWYVPDVMPNFPGGDEALIRFIAENTIYPANAKNRNIQGRVVVNFVIRKDGSISEPEVAVSVDPDLDSEALRVIKLMPDFAQPGYKNGKPVQVMYMLPISFALQ